jgi:hypothetical protein
LTGFFGDGGGLLGGDEELRVELSGELRSELGGELWDGLAGSGVLVGDGSAAKSRNDPESLDEGLVLFAEAEAL